MPTGLATPDLTGWVRLADAATGPARVEAAGGVCVHVNPVWSALTGQDAAAARGDGWRSAMAAPAAGAGEGEGGVSCRPAGLRLAEGGVREFDEIATSIPGPGGRLAGRYVVLVECGWNGAAGRAGMYEERLRAIAETAPDAMITIEESGLIETFSVQAERLFGWTAKEVVGEKINRLMPEPHFTRHDEYMERYLRTGEARIIGQRRALLARRKDGSTFPVELSVGEARIGDRRVFVGFIHDVSVAQKSERRLADLEAELIHVSRLSAMGQMASTIAHELNQPLTAAENFAAAAQRRLKIGSEGDVEKASAAIASTAAQITRAGQIMRRLREFASKGSLERTEENLRKVIEEAITLALIGVGSGLDLDVRRGAGEIMHAQIDRIQIQQVLVNLIRNALEAMSDAPMRRLEISLDEAPGGFARISVADTGTGVSDDVRADLFSPFVTTKREGVGIGLSICRTIVEAHGGAISVENRPGGGAVFRFTLPLSIDEGDLDE